MMRPSGMPAMRLPLLPLGLLLAASVVQARRPERDRHDCLGEDCGSLLQPGPGVKPSSIAMVPPVHTVPIESGSCAEMGCSGFLSKDDTCLCHIDCIHTDNCCADFGDVCMPKVRARSAVAAPPASLPVILFWIAALLVAALTVQLGRLALAMERLSDSVETVDKVLVNSWATLAFKDAALEIRWLANFREKILPGKSRLLAAVMVYLCFDRYRRIDDILTIDCLKGPEGEVNMGFAILNGAFLLLLAAAAFELVRSPDEYKYNAILLFNFVFIPATCLTPFSVSCFELKFACMRDPVKGADYQRVDCSLQGLKSMSLLMTWLLLQPWLMPKYDYVAGMWLWILGLYIGWTVAWEAITREQVFDIWESGYRALLLCVAVFFAGSKKFQLESSHRLRYWEDLKKREEGRRIHSLLAYMVPEHVIPLMLASGGEPIAAEISRVSVLFILITDFDNYADTMTPFKLLNFLNKQFTQIDRICKSNGVTKIETVGEEYVACVGVLPADILENEAQGHGPLLERLMAAADEVLQLQEKQGEGLRFKMGVQTGPVVAGVIGTKLPRYRLCGDTMNSAARMMQKCPPGQLQFGEATHNELTELLKESVTCRGEVEMKGKGKVKVWTFGSEQKPRPKVFHMETSEIVATESMPQDSMPSIDAMQSCGALKVLTRGPTEGLLARQDAKSFDHTLASVGDEVETGGGEGGYNIFTCIMPECRGFTTKLEAEWLEWFHEEAFCQKTALQLGGRVLLFLAASLMELACLITWKIWMYDHVLYPAKYRWPVFVYGRGALVFISLLWCYAFSIDWLRKAPLLTQGLAVLSTCVSVFALFVSYDASAFSQNKLYLEYMRFDEQFRGQRDQALALNFVLFFYLVLSSYHLLFYQALVLLIPYIVCVNAWSLLLLAGWPQDNSNQIPRTTKFLVGVQVWTVIMIAYDAERTSRARFKSLQAIASAKNRTENVLDTLMPPCVAEELRARLPDTPLPAHQYRHTMLVQSDLCGFTSLAATKTPAEVVKFMSDLFGAFDVLTDEHEVYKVETIGDAYIAGMAHQPLTKKYLPANVVWLGLDMVRATADWARNMGVNVTCRVGVHYGECIGGIVGNDMQRYHLFGHLLSALDTCEATSLEARVQISQGAKAEVERQLRNDPVRPWGELRFEERQEPNLQTSKGEVHEYDEVGGRTFLVSADVASDSS